MLPQLLWRRPYTGIFWCVQRDDFESKLLDPGLTIVFRNLVRCRLALSLS